MIAPHPALRFALAGVIALLGAGHVPAAQASTPAFVADMLGRDVQSLRFCRPGERPTRPGQCLLRGTTRPLT